MATDHDIRGTEKSRLAALLDWAFEAEAPVAPRPDSNDQTTDPESPDTIEETN